jgi:hypothetical protein
MTGDSTNNPAAAARKSKRRFITQREFQVLGSWFDVRKTFGVEIHSDFEGKKSSRPKTGSKFELSRSRSSLTSNFEP